MSMMSKVKGGMRCIVLLDPVVGCHGHRWARSVYKLLHVEVYDVTVWFKTNVGIGGTFSVNSFCKSAICTIVTL